VAPRMRLPGQAGKPRAEACQDWVSALPPPKRALLTFPFYRLHFFYLNEFSGSQDCHDV
jgi:hypothetical protein